MRFMLLLKGVRLGMRGRARRTASRRGDFRHRRRGRAAPLPARTAARSGPVSPVSGLRVSPGTVMGC